ncbi:MAG: hypothetical protein KJ879_01705 [Nanoarchaeota archaeon]|nr:hypothetical protein [Nanoarchaeota archaeon]
MKKGTPRLLCLLSAVAIGATAINCDLEPRTHVEGTKEIFEDRNMYYLPKGYSVSKNNISDLLGLAGRDAGTINENGGDFDPNKQRGDLISTCKRTDFNSNKILSESELRKRLREEYNWDPKPL